ncbi:MAG: hypothetical protein J2P15_03210, partial [Micromonosporaceae bacterium]|nr:hypothetical protein [Micromonosporaceae bacterium]
MTGARSAGVPNCAELASDPLVHRYEDMFNPPGLTNFLGAVQTDHDVVAVRSVNFPPYSHGDTVTGQLFLDGRLVRSYGAPVTVVWRPDRVTRTTTVDGVTVTATTACPPETTGVAVDIRLRNHAGSPRRVRLGLTLAATVTRSAGAWNSSHPPAEPNDCRPVAGRAAVLARARGSAAACVQGLD